MKKFALISAILFLVVFLWVNFYSGDKDGYYPAGSPVTASATAGTTAGITLPDYPAGGESGPQLTDRTEDPAFWLIVASFNDLEQAQKAQIEFAEKYQAEIILLPPTSGGFYRLSYGSYLSAREAQEARELLREAGCPNTWLLASGR